MTKPPITRFTSLAVNPVITNKNNGMYAPILNTKEIDAIPDATRVNGGILYDEDANQLKARINGTWEAVAVGKGVGDVIGPNMSKDGNIAVFNGITGKLIEDSGVSITKVTGPIPFASRASSIASLDFSTTNQNKIGNLGYIQFEGGTGFIFVDGDSPVGFTSNDFGSGDQVCSVFTGDLPQATTTPSALVEIQSTNGALVISRMTEMQRDELFETKGMLLFNTTTSAFDGYDGTNWRALALFNANGTLDLNSHKLLNVTTPTLVTDGANKGYVDAAVSGIPTATITLTGNVTGSGVVSSPITTTLNMTLDQITAPVANLNLNSHKIISLLDPTLAQDGATKNYVDTSIAVPAAAKFIIQTTNPSVPNAQVLGGLPTGLLKNNITTGVLTIAENGNDYYSPGNPTRIIDKTNSFFIGTLAGNLTFTGANNTSAGVESLKSISTGFSNSAFGARVLGLVTTGTYNSGFGADCLKNNTGNGHSAFGALSLQSNTTGIFNEAFGASSLFQNTTGSTNSAFGASSLFNNVSGNNNCAFGSSSSVSSVTGDSNSTFGYNSFLLNQTGSNNVCMGAVSAAAQINYNNCSFLGYGADASINNLTNAIAIGYQASVSASNCMVLGGSGANQLSVGIGVTPHAELQFSNSIASRKIVLYETANSDHLVYGLGLKSAFLTMNFTFQVPDASSDYIFYSGVNGSLSTELLRLTGDGFLGIGTNSPNVPLQFANSLASRKIVLSQTANNDHQVYGFGVVAFGAGGALRYQTDATTSSHVWFAGTSPTTSNELMRLTGTGFLGIGGVTPHAPLQFLNNISTNRQIVLFQTADNEHQFYGLGINNGIFRFQIDSTAAHYVWYAGTAPTTSNELMRLHGNGNLSLGTITQSARVTLNGGVQTTAGQTSVILATADDTNVTVLGLENKFGTASLWEIRNNRGASCLDFTNRTNSTTPFYFLDNGRMGIGTATPDQLLTVNSANASKIGAGLWAGFSDARIKDIVGDYEHGLSEIIQIQPRKFKYNDKSGYPESEKAKTNIGVIAQEIEDIFPECIVEKVQRGDIPDMRVYDGTALTYALINAVKELNNEIIKLKQQINNQR